MHVLLPPPKETTIEVTAPNRRRYAIRFLYGQAWVPLHLGQHLIAEKLALRGEERDPVRWERLPGGGHGKLVDAYADHVTELP
jgi:hypothetical protein